MNYLEKQYKKLWLIGYGTFKLSVDTEITEYPIIEFTAVPILTLGIKEVRLQEVLFYALLHS